MIRHAGRRESFLSGQAEAKTNPSPKLSDVGVKSICFDGRVLFSAPRCHQLGAETQHSRAKYLDIFEVLSRSLATVAVYRVGSSQ